MIVPDDNINVFNKVSDTYDPSYVDKAQNNETWQPHDRPHSCVICGKHFSQTSEYSFHMEKFHSDSQHFPCYFCGLIFLYLNDLKEHISKEHDMNISQVDGTDLDLFEFDEPPAEIRIANYALNQTKQTNKIVKDTSIEDFEVTLNNNDSNANIKCSTGFYVQVAKPTFASLHGGTVFSKDDIAISLTESSQTKDLKVHMSTQILCQNSQVMEVLLSIFTIHLEQFKSKAATSCPTKPELHDGSSTSSSRSLLTLPRPRNSLSDPPTKLSADLKLPLLRNLTMSTIPVPNVPRFLTQNQNLASVKHATTTSIKLVTKNTEEAAIPKTAEALQLPSQTLQYPHLLQLHLFPHVL